VPRHKETSTAETEKTLQALLQAIASRDRPSTLKLLTQSPNLATLSTNIGATRDEAKAYFFKEILHYAYAGDTPLHIAAAAYQRDIAAELVARGANIGARNRRGAEPLHYAADGIPDSQYWNPDAQYDVVAYLIGHGANPNSEDKSGVAPLHRAVRTRSTAAVEALLLNGADVVRRNKNGSTPLHLAVQDTGRGGSGSTTSREQQSEIIRLLLRHGARPSDRDFAGTPVIDCARADWIRKLLQS
jgi:ankyrin repeat protein